jgi:hypothetical protein
MSPNVSAGNCAVGFLLLNAPDEEGHVAEPRDTGSVGMLVTVKGVDER